MDTTASTSTLLQDRFATVMLGVCEEAGAAGARDRLMAPLLALLCRRLYRVMSQVSRVLARMQAGILSIRRPTRTRTALGGSRRTPRTPDALRFRYGWAWLIRVTPRAAQYAPLVQILLDEPEMQAALAASPSLRRAVRPLCRGLAFPTPPVLVEARKRAPGPPNSADYAASRTDSTSGPLWTDGLGRDLSAGVAELNRAPPLHFAPPLAATPSTPSIRAAPPDGRTRPTGPLRLLRLFTR